MRALPRSAGIHERTLELEDGSTARFTLSTPPDLAEGKRVPVVVVLHYKGEVTPFFGRGILERLALPALASLGGILVAPDAVDGHWETPGSERAVLGILDAVIAAYPVDTARVVVCGYSYGGIGAWHLAHAYPGRFSAGIAMASRPPRHERFEIPVLAIQSRGDELLSFDAMEHFVGGLRERGQPVDLVALEGVGHYETDRFVEPLRAAIPWLEERWARG